jgi:SlyX protein
MNITDDALEQIQTKIAFLERANTELSDAVYRQQLELRALGARLACLIERLDTLQPDDPQRSPADERPPHY